MKLGINISNNPLHPCSFNGAKLPTHNLLYKLMCSEVHEILRMSRVIAVAFVLLLSSISTNDGFAQSCGLSLQAAATGCFEKYTVNHFCTKLIADSTKTMMGACDPNSISNRILGYYDTVWCNLFVKSRDRIVKSCSDRVEKVERTISNIQACRNVSARTVNDTADKFLNSSADEANKACSKIAGHMNPLEIGKRMSTLSTFLRSFVDDAFGTINKLSSEIQARIDGSGNGEYSSALRGALGDVSAIRSGVSSNYNELQNALNQPINSDDDLSSIDDDLDRITHDATKRGTSGIGNLADGTLGDRSDAARSSVDRGISEAERASSDADAELARRTGQRLSELNNGSNNGRQGNNQGSVGNGQGETSRKRCPTGYVGIRWTRAIGGRPDKDGCGCMKVCQFRNPNGSCQGVNPEDLYHCDQVWLKK